MTVNEVLQRWKWLKLVKIYARAFFKFLLGVAALAVPVIFPDNIKYQYGHPITTTLRVYGILLFLSSGLDTYDRNAEKKLEQKRLRRANFFLKYSASTTQVLKNVQDLHAYEDLECDDAINAVIKIIRSVIISYADNVDDAHLNVNVMRFLPFTSKLTVDLGDKLYFYDRQLRVDAYLGVLQVTNWANDDHCVPNGFSIPVHALRQKVLFGAPRAYLTGTVQIIEDLKTKKKIDILISGQDSSMKGVVRRYLEERSSFCHAICIRLEHNSKLLGVLNIQVNKPGAFGYNTAAGESVLTEEAKDYVLPLCAPFIEALGMILAQASSVYAAS